MSHGHGHEGTGSGLLAWIGVIGGIVYVAAYKLWEIATDGILGFLFVAAIVAFVILMGRECRDAYREGKTDARKRDWMRREAAREQHAREEAMWRQEYEEKRRGRR
jgi:uncharacterized membrane protein